MAIQNDFYFRDLNLKPLLGLCFAICIAVSANAMPPAPGLVDQMRQEGSLDELVAQQRNARTRGVDEPFRFDLARFQRDGADETTLRVICILVDFEDNIADAEVNSVDHFQQMLFSEGEYETGSMRDWFLENSYGEVQIIGEVVGWYRMPNSYAYYVNGSRGFGEYPQNAQRLTEDAIGAADADVDFTSFDNDQDRIVEGVFIVHAGVGAEENGSNDMIWSHAWGIPNHVRADTMRFVTYAMEPENGRIGVFGHELGHSLFGLPDLYDTNYQSAGVGMWSMMSGGSWGGGGLRPVHFDVYSKQRIGFVSPFPVTEESPDLVIEPIETTADALYVWRKNDWDSEYFLIENRQRIGFDAELPGSGILIWHCDDLAENNSHPWWPDHQDSGHNKVALEQADGAYDLEMNVNSGDDGDPWPGLAWKEIFSDESEPNSKDYAGNPTGVSVHRIEEDQANRMRCDISLEGPPPAVEPILFLFEKIPEAHRFPHPDARGDVDTTDEASLVLDLLNQAGIQPTGRGHSIPENIYDYNVVLYLESWRDDEDPLPGLTDLEQSDLAVFLEIGGKLILVGPDVATNLQSDTTLWSHLHAEYVGEGESREVGNVRRLESNPSSRITGQNFIYLQRGICDHYVDVVNPGVGAQSLFTDQNGNSRGVLYAGRNGSRVILQTTMFGGMVDWGGTKAELMRLYFDYLRFTPMSIADSDPVGVAGDFHFTSAWPNPFNQTVNFHWEGASSSAILNVLDVTGRRVGLLQLNAPSGRSSWTALGLPAGTYLMNLSGSNSPPLKIQLVK